MSEMIERVARAICAQQSEHQFWQHFEAQARAAIAAMREPTKEMVVAGMMEDHDFNLPDNGRSGIYRAMIDAALAQ